MIKTKYDIYDSVWILSEEHIYKPCNICSNGKVFIKEEEFKCPKCNGSVRGNYLYSIHKATEMVVLKITITKTADEFVTIYGIAAKDFLDIDFISSREENTLYDSFEVAQEIANKKNLEKLKQFENQEVLAKSFKQKIENITNDYN